jgi:hypothetical protein
MADQKRQQEAGNRDRELDDQQLDQVAGGTTRTDSTDPTALKGTYAAVGAPKKDFAEKVGGVAQGVAQVGLGVAAN